VAVSKTSGLTGETIEVAWRVNNDGLASALGSWVDRIYLSQDAYLSSNELLTSVSHSGPLRVGEFYESVRQVTLPSVPGTYRVYVVSDATNFIIEGEEGNNIGVSEEISVSPAYRAVVETDVTVAPNGTPIPLRGQVLPAAEGISVAGRPVAIHVNVRGMRRVIQAISDADGHFEATFRPLPFEAGQYTISADHPGVAQHPSAQDSFTLVGMRPIPDRLSLRLTPGVPLSGEITLENLSDVPLTGLRAVVLGSMQNVDLSLDVPETLPGDGSVKLTYALTAQDASLRRGLVRFRLDSDEGASQEVAVMIDVVPLVPQLLANPGFLSAGMLRGEQTFVSFEVTNTGGAPTGPLEVRLPAGFSWLGLASQETLDPLAPGQKTVVTLRLTPADDLPLNVYTGNLAVVDTGNFFANVQFQFRAVSDAVGDLQVTVTDDFTYHVEGEPKVADAAVRVRDAFRQFDRRGRGDDGRERQGDAAESARGQLHAGSRGCQASDLPQHVPHPTGRVERDDDLHQTRFDHLSLERRAHRDPGPLPDHTGIDLRDERPGPGGDDRGAAALAGIGHRRDRSDRRDGDQPRFDPSRGCQVAVAAIGRIPADRPDAGTGHAARQERHHGAGDGRAIA
jgi:hypothetical protein